MLIPGQRNVVPGDTLTVLVQAPVCARRRIATTLRRNGLVKKERFTMTGPTHELSIDIDPAYLPNITAQVDLVGAATRVSDSGAPLPDAPKRPAFATGSLPIKISTASRALTVDVRPQDRELSPGESTTLDIAVNDASGAPVPNAEMAVSVVDEAVLSLSGYTMGSAQVGVARIPDP